MRYRSWKTVPQPESNAVIIAESLRRHLPEAGVALLCAALLFAALLFTALFFAALAGLSADGAFAATHALGDLDGDL